MHRITGSLIALRPALALVAALAASLVSAQLANRAEPLPGITTSAQPDAAALEQAADEGFVAVIDLRGPDEPRGLDEPAVVEGLGMSYIPLPVVGPDGISYENASALDRILGGIDGPVLIHCSSGNRAGALLALRARLAGASADEAMALGEAGGVTRDDVRAVVAERLEER